MTGTASQPVVRDIIVELISKKNKVLNVVKAETYKRDELNFSVELTNPDDKKRS